MRILVLVLASRIVYSEISSSSDLNCDFTSTCRWRNSTEGGGNFQISNLVEADAQTRIMPMDENNPKPFIYTAGLMGRTLGLLVSEVVTCQLGGASIKYWYFKTSQNSQLEVCIRQPPGNRDLSTMRCYDGSSSTFGHQWIFRAVELPPIAQPFEIVFKTLFSPPSDVIALDDIVYEATLCESSNNGASEGAGGNFGDSTRIDDFGSTNLADFDGNDVSIDTTQFGYLPDSVTLPSRPVNFGAPTSHGKRSDVNAPRSGPMYTSLCPAIDCNFDDNSLCNYVTSSSNSSSQDGSTLRKWMLTNRSVLNSLTGIPSDVSRGGFFIYAGGIDANPMDIFIMSSTHPIIIKQPSRLDLFVFQAGIRGQLRICLNDDSNCPMVLSGRDIDVDSQKWKNYYIDLPIGEHVIHIIADGLYPNYAIGIDNIQLLNKFGTASQSC